MLIVVVITVPLLLTYNNDLSFNTIDEIDNSKESVMGLNVISEAFGEGDSLPVQVLLKKDSSIVNETDVTYLESISRNLEKVDGVKTVRTITRPTGEIIEDLYVDHQLGLMSDGLDEASSGLGKVQKGLTEVQNGLDQVTGMFNNSSSIGADNAGLAQAAGGIGQLAVGLGASNTGLDEIGRGLGELSTTLKK